MGYSLERLPGTKTNAMVSVHQQMEMNALLAPTPSSLSNGVGGGGSNGGGVHGSGGSMGHGGASCANSVGAIGQRAVHVAEYPLHAVRFQHELGEGAFGKVSFPGLFFLIVIKIITSFQCDWIGCIKQNPVRVKNK